MTLAIEDIVNQALDTIGFGKPISDILEGTKASRLALRLYGQSRDELLREKDWPFARRTTVLTLLKSAGVPPYGGSVWNSNYPLPPWKYEYLYPADSIIIRYIRTTPTGIPNLDPTPVLWTIANDSAYLNANNEGTKVILTNEVDALAVYTGQIVDPSTFEPLFIESLIENLAKRFTLSLTQSPDLLKEKVQEMAATAEVASQRGG